ncbi:MAG: AAA family ATPase [Propionibacteriaceae bacterium]|nr:AAA family ATPase [Propionibacteriaceae bacterium]
MLVSFSVSNYRSFRDQAVLDLRAPHGRASGAKPWDGNIQSVAAVYGANASGKTSLFNAVKAMADQVSQSYRSRVQPSEPFAFDEVSRTRPTEFSATFIAPDGICYAYGFGLLGGLVVDEWAERYSTARPTLLFQRDQMGVKFGKALKGANQAVERIMRPDALYLSAAAAAEHDGLAPLYQWFAGRLLLFPALIHRQLINQVLAVLDKDPAHRQRVTDILIRADLGLVGVEATRRESFDSDRREDQTLLKMLSQFVGRNLSMDPADDDEFEAFATHVANGQTYRLPLDLESDGTRAMLCHAYIIDLALREGSTLVFDELDTSLHPLLVRELVRLFQDRRSNSEQAQLIFTTHDVSLLEAGYGDGAQLGRDEVWLTDKDDSGRSSLTPLADFGPRTRENLARRYLSGRYGGVPDQLDLFDPALV